MKQSVIKRLQIGCKQCASTIGKIKNDAIMAWRGVAWRITPNYALISPTHAHTNSSNNTHTTQKHSKKPSASIIYTAETAQKPTSAAENTSATSSNTPPQTISKKRVAVSSLYDIDLLSDHVRAARARSFTELNTVAFQVAGVSHA